MYVSVVIPVYNAAARLPRLVERLFAVLDATGEPCEVVLVDDGSRDDSWQVLGRLHAQYSGRLSAVQLMRNYGQHNALMAGFRHARGRFVVTMDDDFQHPPEEILTLLRAITAADLDLVYGCYAAKQHSGWRNLGSVLVNAFYRVVFRTHVAVTAFRVIRRELLDTILGYSFYYTYIDGLLAWNTERVGEVPVQHQLRAEGRSGYSLGRLLLLALNLFANFSLLPLQVVGGLGFLAAGAGFALAGYYFLQYLLSNITVPGYASTIIAILVMGGAQLVSLGVMGEYLGRLHLNVNRKPQYFERQVLGASAAGGSDGMGRPAAAPGPPVAGPTGRG
jgi:polyisoprenyl-phosphate glycosyltransferase